MSLYRALRALGTFSVVLRSALSSSFPATPRHSPTPTHFELVEIDLRHQTMKACDACVGARAFLADAFRILASGTAFWFVVNSEDHYNENFSLCSRLGLTARDYETLLVGARLATYNTHSLFKPSPNLTGKHDSV